MPELMNMVHQVKALGRKLNAKTLDLMKANGSSLVSVYVGDALLKGNFSVFTESEIDAIHDLVDPLLLSSPMGEKFEEVKEWERLRRHCSLLNTCSLLEARQLIFK